MVEALLRFLNIDQYAPSNGRQPRFLIDQLPQVYCRPSEDSVRRLLLRKGADDAEVKAVQQRLDQWGCCYVAAGRALLVRDFQLANAAEEAARFVYSACRGADGNASAEDRFYARVLEHGLAYFGARALYPARAAVREVDLYALYSLDREAVDELNICSYREFMETIDFLVLHKDYETNLRHYYARPQGLGAGVACEGERFNFATTQLGYMLGSELYDAYLSGRIAKRFLRSLFFRKLKPGTARTTYFATQRRLRQRRK